MTDAIIEAAARAMPSFWTEQDKKWIAHDILAAVTPLIEADALERAAKVAEDHEATEERTLYLLRQKIAVAIRALKDQS
jgi:hypothetical protein